MFESGFGGNSQIWCRFGGIICGESGSFRVGQIARQLLR
jgi:hypothetical protein